MKNSTAKLCVIICLIFTACILASLFIFRDAANLSPRAKGGFVELPVYADGNDSRVAIIEKSGKSVLVLNYDGTFLYKLNAKSIFKKNFTLAKTSAFDERNNLYILDTVFNGVEEQNTERIIKFSPEGKFLGEMYSYSYLNEDFIITKGKIAGFAVSKGVMHIVRLENEGFYLERAILNSYDKPTIVKGFIYPNAFRDLVFFHINLDTRLLTWTTKAGEIKQISFDGSMFKSIAAQNGALPWSAVSDENFDIFYSDILKNKIEKISGGDALAASILQDSFESASPYFRINYSAKKIFATSYDNIIIIEKEHDAVVLDSYTFVESKIKLRMIWFCLFGFAVLFFIGLIIFTVSLLSKIKTGEMLKKIILVVFCITFGAVLASVLVIDQLKKTYYSQTYKDLENITRFAAGNIDVDFILSLSQPNQYSSVEYLNFKENMKSLIYQLSLKGKSMYQMIFVERNGTIYIMCELENSSGLFYNMGAYSESIYEQVKESKEYLHEEQTTNDGSWLFITGPLYDKEGNVAAFIETGYALPGFQLELKKLIIQISLIVISAIIVFILIMIEVIVILRAYNTNKKLIAARKAPVFMPEYVRAVCFFLFSTTNIAAAILPLYAANLYMPIFNMPREFIVTLPFTADVVSAALALIIIPNIIKFIKLKRLCVLSALLLAAGNILCFTAPNIILLSVAYAMIGFSGGAMILLLNTIIGAQKTGTKINEGFAHFNASYLSGLNAGVVFGAIIAQFFSYRIVFLFSSATAIMLLFVAIFSLHSKAVNFVYKIKYIAQKERRRWTLVKFLLKPIVLATLLLLLLPYIVSMSFVNYFVPVFGINNGLTESNIGQLILLNGLFAILFGAPLCKYALKRFKMISVLIFALTLNLLSIIIFSIKPSVFLLVISIILISIANIFALTNIQTWYAALYQRDRVSSMKALSIYSAVENLSFAIGPILFSYILAGNINSGLMMFSVFLIEALCLFIIIACCQKRRQSSE